MLAAHMKLLLEVLPLGQDLSAMPTLEVFDTGGNKITRRGTIAESAVLLACAT
jgi:hypothetical protein